MGRAQGGPTGSAGGRRGQPSELRGPFLGPFRDDPESRFYESRMRGLRNEQTWAEVERQLTRTLAGARDTFLGRPLRMTPEQLERWHYTIFGRLFSRFEGAGRVRQAHEPAQFGIPVTRGGEHYTRYLDGAEPAAIDAELQAAFRRFERGVDEMPGPRVPPALVALAASRLYTDILRIHPFVDGNHRASYVALAAALWSFRLPLVRFPAVEDMRAHDDAVALAVRPDTRDPQPFAALLAQRLRGAAP